MEALLRFNEGDSLIYKRFWDKVLPTSCYERLINYCLFSNALTAP